MQHVHASNLAEEERRISDELKFAKLDAIDRLLWGTKSRSTVDGSEGDLLSLLCMMSLLLGH